MLFKNPLRPNQKFMTCKQTYRATKTDHWATFKWYEQIPHQKYNKVEFKERCLWSGCMNILGGWYKEINCHLSLMKIDLFWGVSNQSCMPNTSFLKLKQNRWSSISLEVGVKTHMNNQGHTHGTVVLINLHSPGENCGFLFIQGKMPNHAENLSFIYGWCSDQAIYSLIVFVCPY